MTVPVSGAVPSDERSLAWLGDSEMARRVLSYDWSSTSLGPIAEWPLSLKSAVVICLRSRFQMAVYWGPELICIYNDAERDVLGDLHPDALGSTAPELWRDSWEVVGPQLRAVMRRGDATWEVDSAWTFDRGGSLEVGYFTYSCSPVPDDQGRVGGVLLVSEDTTARVLARVRSESAAATARAEEHERAQRELRALLDELRATQRRVAIAADAERRRIERDLHDGAQQRLMAIRLELGLVDEIVENDPRAARAKLDSIRSDLDEALEEMRELAHGLCPPLLASDGLAAALSATARRAAIPVTILGSETQRVPRSIETAAYFCCLEALQNAAKHAGRDARATIRLRLSAGVFEFSVSDDGDGFDPATTHEGHGLTNLRDRLATLGGQAEIISSPGEGTTILGQIPIS